MIKEKVHDRGLPLFERLIERRGSRGIVVARTFIINSPSFEGFDKVHSSENE